MSDNSSSDYGTVFKVGWIILLVISALAALNHIILIFVLEEQVLFIGWAAFNLYSTVVLYIPFQRGEKWAWFTSWMLALGLAGVMPFDAEIGPFYVGAAILVAVGLLMTRPAFFPEQAAVSQA